MAESKFMDPGSVQNYNDPSKYEPVAYIQPSWTGKLRCQQRIYNMALKNTVSAYVFSRNIVVSKGVPCLDQY